MRKRSPRQKSPRLGKGSPRLGKGSPRLGKRSPRRKESFPRRPVPPIRQERRRTRDFEFASLIAVGLTLEGSLTSEKWSSFLLKGLYDPRLLILIAKFIYSRN